MKERTINPDLIPILTETADGTVLDLPTLTDTVGETPSPAAKAQYSLSDEHCKKLAARLFPQLEITLRAAIGTRSEARWAKSMQQVQAELPNLIRSSIPKQH